MLSLLAAKWLGMGMQLVVLLIPCGVVSLVISWRDITRPKKMDRNQIALMPFASIRELLALHRRVPTFRKRKCPAGIKP